jgi:demethylmenaquinone methyltransferase/2-methoxy-6-polyprenyl-1,4-benzoquinol methylase
VTEQRSRDDSPSILSRADLDERVGDPSRRQSFVTAMFDEIAPRYDAFTRLFSFGMDARWKRQLLAWVRTHAPSGGVAVDVACGTGDLALGLLGDAWCGDVIAADISRRMIALARERARPVAPGPLFICADIMRLPLRNASVSVITAGYALRNVPDFRAALHLLARIVRSGGALITLDFYKPAAPLWRFLFLRYLSAAGHIVGWLWHRRPAVYGYIGRSIELHVTAGEFRRALEEAGFEIVAEKRWLLGGISAHCARRNPSVASTPAGGG